MKLCKVVSAAIDRNIRVDATIGCAARMEEAPTMRMCLVPALFIILSLLLPVQAQVIVSFPSMDADLTGGAPTTIAAHLYKPEGDGPHPVVVAMHGCDGVVEPDGKVRRLYASWAEALAADGYLVLLPDALGSRGHGNLCAIQPISARPVQADREIFRDNYGALAYLRTRNDVRSGSVALLGQSFGAATVLYTIAADLRPKGLEPEQDFKAAIAFYPPCQPFLTRERKWKPRRPLLFLMGEADNFTPPAPCKTMLAAATEEGASIEAHWYDGAHHLFDHPDLPERIVTSVKLPPNGHSPTVGSHPAARADAILKVKAFLAATIK